MRSLTGAVCIKLLTKPTIKGAHYRGISPMSIWRAVEIGPDGLAGGRSSATHPNLDDAPDSEAL
jgi:hypothetical protein